MFNKLVATTKDNVSYALEVAKEFKESYDIIKDGKLYTLLEDFERDYVYELEGNKVDVVSNGLLLMVMNMSAGAALNIGNGYMILLDESFDTMPGFVQDFILKHEEAHILNGDLEVGIIRGLVRNFKRSLFAPLGIVSKEERLADYHAYQKNGKEQTISALEFLREEIESYDGINLKEVDTRIKLIKSYK